MVSESMTMAIYEHHETPQTTLSTIKDLYTGANYFNLIFDNCWTYNEKVAGCLLV